MYDLIILGLLIEDNLHGYQLKQKIDHLLAGVFSSSYGSLYPALKKLEGQNYIGSKTSFSEGGQEKTIYLMTSKGEEYFLSLMLAIPKENFQTAWLRFQIKTLFFAYLDSNGVNTLIDDMIKRTNLEIAKKEKILSSVNLNKYQLYCINKSFNDLKNNINWLERLLVI